MILSMDRVRQALSVLVVLVVWYLATTVFGVITSTALPSPVRIATSASTLLTDTSFLTHVSATARRTVIASLLAVPSGVVVGIAMGWDERVKEALSPLLYAIYPMPVIALLPLIGLAFGNNDRALIFVAALGGFFVLVWNAMTAVQGINTVYFDVARDNGATSAYAIFREVLLPGTLSLVFTGLRLCLSTALLIVISVEFITADTGLGFFVWQSWRLYRLPEMYSAILVIGLFGIVITYGLQSLHARLVPWQSDFEERVFV